MPSLVTAWAGAECLPLGQDPSSLPPKFPNVLSVRPKAGGFLKENLDFWSSRARMESHRLRGQARPLCPAQVTAARSLRPGSYPGRGPEARPPAGLPAPAAAAPPRGPSRARSPLGAWAPALLRLGLRPVPVPGSQRRLGSGCYWVGMARLQTPAPFQRPAFLWRGLRRRHGLWSGRGRSREERPARDPQLLAPQRSSAALPPRMVGTLG